MYFEHVSLIGGLVYTFVLFYRYQGSDSTKEVDPLGNPDWYLLDVPLTMSVETQINGTGLDCLPGIITKYLVESSCENLLIGLQLI